MKKLFLLLITAFSFSASFAAADEYKKNDPRFYAKLAVVANHIGLGSESKMRYYFENGYGEKKAILLKKGEFDHAGYGKINWIVVQDNKGLIHVAFKGGDCKGHTFMSFKNIPTNVLKNIQQRLSKYEKKYGKITTIVGHALGGAVASQLVEEYKGKYQNVQVITFNGFFVKEAPNQLHLLMPHSNLANKWIKSYSRYKQLSSSGWVTLDQEMEKISDKLYKKGSCFVSVDWDYIASLKQSSSVVY